MESSNWVRIPLLGVSSSFYSSSFTSTSKFTTSMTAFVSPLTLRCAPSARCAACTRRAPVAVAASPASAPPAVKWQCTPGCGACCRIGGYDAEVLDEMLRDEADMKKYVSMLGDDGWCKNFDKENRSCGVYEERPWFCRVTKESFGKLYEFEDINKFAIECCFFHIDDVYGPRSGEMNRFEQAVGVRWIAEADGPEDTPEGEGGVEGDAQLPGQNADEGEEEQEIVWADDLVDCDQEACEVPLFDVPEDEKL